MVQDRRVFLTSPEQCTNCLIGRCQCWIGPALIRVAICIIDGREPNLEKIFEIYDRARGI